MDIIVFSFLKFQFFVSLIFFNVGFCFQIEFFLLCYLLSPYFYLRLKFSPFFSSFLRMCMGEVIGLRSLYSLECVFNVRNSPLSTSFLPQNFEI